MPTVDFTADEIRALRDAALAPEDLITERLQPGAHWDTTWYRSPALQAAFDKLADALDATEQGPTD